MRTARSVVTAPLFLAAGLGLAGCQTASGAETAEEAIRAAASVETDAAGGPSRLTLSEDAIERLRLLTSPVVDDGAGLAVPYAAVVYDAEGDTWVFVELEDRTFQRQPITITSITGPTVLVSSGPPAGTEVVTVAAAELVGVEAGISGGE